MEIIKRAAVNPRRIAVFPGTFNPPTIAHVGLAMAALTYADEVLFAIPRAFPHKDYFGATLDERIEMLNAVVPLRTSIGIAERGLFIDIARELRAHYPDSELLFVCGRDAAERIVEWRYETESIEEMLSEFRLLVAERQGSYRPPEHLAHAVVGLQCESYGEISSSAVRDLIATGGDWEHLVPDAIRQTVGRIYSR